MKSKVLKPMMALAFSVVLVIMVVMPFFTEVASAQEDVAKFPSRPITFISPLPSGAGADVGFHLVAKEAEKFLGQPIVVLNKPGGGLTIGAAAIASAKPDGYTVGYVSTTSLVITPFLEKVPYDPLKDFQQIMQFGEFNLGVIVKGDSPFKKFRDLIEYARQNPKKVTYGTQGTTSISRLLVEQITKKEGVEFTHIPYRGSPETEAALLGGHILFSGASFTDTLIESGETRLLLLFSEKRRTAYHQVPILKDLGYDFPAPMFLNIAAPNGLPKEIAKKLEDAFTRAMKEPAFIEGMNKLALPIAHRNSQELTEYVARIHGDFEKLLKDLGLIK